MGKRLLYDRISKLREKWWLAEHLDDDDEDKEEMKEQAPEESSAFEEKKRDMKDSAKASLTISAIQEV